MIFIAKAIGLMLVVGVPTSIGGIQLYLKNKTISTARSNIQKEIEKTAVSIQATTASFTKEIERITTEKNELANTKTALTYKPVVIQTNIEAMDDAKKKYEGNHKTLQASIKTVIETHKASVTSKQTEIEGLWTKEKTRVEELKKALDKKIDAAKKANTALQKEIDEAKVIIEKTINDVFSPPAP